MKIVKIADELYVPENFKRFHSYFADPEGTKEYSGITSVLGIVAKPALIPWAANQVIEYIKANCEKEHSLGYVGITHIVREPELEAARTAHTKKKEDAAAKGTDLHALVEEYVQHMIATYDGHANFEAEREAIQPFMKWASENKIRFIAAEARLYSKTHWIAGTCDLIFEKDGKRYVGDIKTYKKIWDKLPLAQCGAYSLMYEEMHDKKWNEENAHLDNGTRRAMSRIDGHCVICLPKDRAFDESSDVLWSFDTQGDREVFLSALKIYRYLKN